MNEVTLIEEKFTRCPRCRSFSVKKTEANFIERIKDRFVPVTVQFCNNCSYRFAEYGKFSVKYKKNWLLVVVPLVVVAVLAAVFFVSGGEKAAIIEPADEIPPMNDSTTITPPPTTKTPTTAPTTAPTTTPTTTPTTKTPTTIKEDEITETKPDETGEITEEKTTEVKTETPPVTKDDKETTENATEMTAKEKPGIEIENEIIIGNSNRFGVNWSPVENGVQITRLSPGPLKDAGFQLGDVISEIDGSRITSGNLLLTIRNEIFNKKRGGALIKVYRNNELFYYKLVKSAGQELQPTTQPKEPTVQKELPPAPIFVFQASMIKKRSSAPDSESPAHRWCFVKKEITVKREAHQKVFVTGNAAGTKNWGVDDQLVINGRQFDGLSGSYEETSGPLPESSTCTPLDITDLVPPGRETSLLVELVDHGIQWGNTDIYVVVK